MAVNTRRRPVAVARSRSEAVHESQDEPQGPEPQPLTAGRRAIKAFSIGPVKPVWDRWINAMFYGPYGHGKTTLAATATDVPEMQDVLFINAESGTMSLTSRRTMDFIDINKYDQMARIFEYMTLHCKWRDEGNIEKLLEYERELKSGIVALADQTEPTDPERTWFEEQRIRTGKPMDEPYMYRTVIIDSLSEVHKYLVYKFTGVDIGKTKLDEEIERMDSWQEAQEMFRLMIRSFRDLPMNVIFVSAENIEPAEKNKKRNPIAGMSLPKLAGQMAGDVAGFIDIVGYLVREIEGGDQNRYLYLGAGYEGWISKHRFENLPDLEYLEGLPGTHGPTMAQLIDLSRKDAEHGSSFANTEALSRSLTTTRNTARTAAPDSSRPANAATGSSRRGNAVRRRRAG